MQGRKDTFHCLILWETSWFFGKPVIQACWHKGSKSKSTADGNFSGHLLPYKGTWKGRVKQFSGCLISSPLLRAGPGADSLCSHCCLLGASDSNTENHCVWPRRWNGKWRKYWEGTQSLESLLETSNKVKTLLQLELDWQPKGNLCEFGMVDRKERRQKGDEPIKPYL